jgi:SNF2 family DNA or RNA helicase
MTMETSKPKKPKSKSKKKSKSKSKHKKTSKSKNPVSSDPLLAPGTELKPHQKEAVGWVKSRERLRYDGCLGGFNMDDTGLGKTLTMLYATISDWTAIKDTYDDETFINTTLIVCTASTLNVWYRQELLNRTTFPRDKVTLYWGTNRKDFVRYEDVSSSKWGIMNTVRKQIGCWGLASFPFRLGVLS